MNEPVEGSFATTTQGIEVNAPDGTSFANVTANGTGCRPGTWAVDISPDHETFTLTFSEYEATLDPGRPFVDKNCQLGITIHTPQGFSYSVANFFYSGYAFMDTNGMTARQTAGYYFQGNPADQASARSELRGPTDEFYTFNDEVGLADLVWSPCGAERLLNVPTRIQMFNNRTRTGSGYINTTAVDGSIKLVLRLSWRTC